ncbi:MULTISPECIES: TetR/AcrR family transcriptional regulator [unclassified Mycobacterium]|uniref:TetR/AcrR family transcriptional regulator n=1 Tax=unclassified Mycobacterium TaxID=2642494 RepID=UPI0029C6EE53|nr:MULTISPECIES: TetR/AcrR family transcriptional regulator [unclassified Mycobacterium]
MSTAKKARASYHHGDLKRALTEAALALVTEKGPKGFTLSEAARRAGVSLAAPYRHFADKADLLASVAEQGFLELTEASAAAGHGISDPRARLTELSRAYVRWAVAHPDYYQVMFGAETKDKADHPGLLTAGAQAFDTLLGVINEGIEAGLLHGDDPLKLAGTMWSMVHGIAALAIGGDLHHVGIDEDPEHLAEQATNDLLDGLART